MSLYFSITPVVDNNQTYVVSSGPFYSSSSSGTDIESKVSNWQAALVEGDANSKDIEFHVTGLRNSAIPGKSNETTRAVINGLQVIPVVEFIQPGVNADNVPLEYGPLPPGEYLLMHVHGGVNVAGSNPKYAGGFYRFVYSTEDNPEGPQIVRLHHPEIGRYNTGPEVVEAYSGKQYSFTHTGGYIQFSFDDISEHFTDNQVTAGQWTGPHVVHGLNYANTAGANPIAPVFVLIDLSKLTADDGAVNPPIFCPSYGLIAPSGEDVTIYSTTPGDVDIYYTKTVAVEGFEPLDPPVPSFDEDGDPTGTTTLYTTPIQILEATKFKAVAKKTGMLDSVLTSVYYYGKKKVTDVVNLEDEDDDVSDDVVANVVITPGSSILPISDAVQLLCSTPGATIYYTISTTLGVDENVVDPATPTTASTLYTVPIAVNIPTKIKAFAVKTGSLDSGISSASYTTYDDFLPAPIFSPISGQFTEEEFGESFTCSISLSI